MSFGQNTAPTSNSERPEFERPPVDSIAIGDVERPLGFFERLFQSEVVQRLNILIALIVIWQVYAWWLNDDLLFPSFTETARMFWGDMQSGLLFNRTITSLQTLALGYGAGLAIAAAFTTFAVISKTGTRILSTLTAMFNPLPSIALLPLALIWFGLGEGSVIFVIIHAVLWSVALNTHSGFREVSRTLRMVGQNYGLTGFRYVLRILIPGAFPSILTGLKIGWAGAILGIFSGWSTGFGFAAITTMAPALADIEPLSILLYSPYGIMELSAYSIAMSRSFHIVYSIVKRVNPTLLIKPSLAEIGIATGLLLVAGFLEEYMIALSQ